MSDVLLLHHIQGRTAGMQALADRLRAAGHTVHDPDLFDGRTFASIEEGFAYAKSVGTDALEQRGFEAADGLPEGLVAIGVSFGVVAAQRLAQTRPGVAAGVFIASCLPVEVFGSWPDGVAAQIHGAEGDTMFMEEGDLDAARRLVAETSTAELFLYPARDHLYLDSSLPGYDAEAADLTITRILGLLDRAA